MARITVEDCVTRVPNRFELVMLAAQRARDVSAGAPLTVERDNDKNPVVALREIADGTVELDHLRYELIHGLRRHVEIEDQPDDLMMGYEDHPMVEPGPPLAVALEDEQVVGLVLDLDVTAQADDLMMGYEDHPMVEPGPPLAVALEDEQVDDDPGEAPQPDSEDDPRFE